MTLEKLLTTALVVSLSAPAVVLAAAANPVNPKATAEARALLQVLQDISGKHTLAGQHNYPNTRSRNSEFVKLYVGETPAVYSQDWGFAADGDKDSYLARPDIVEEVKRQHASGAIVTLCWHAVPPTADEPVVFRGNVLADGAPQPDLASVQGRLTDEQFRDVLTPGTRLHERWLRQVDTIAGFLAQLKEARIPVLWRPYHEMNGDWFWWGGRGADTAALYRLMFDRFVKHHKLDNLVWVWSVDRPGEHATSFESVYPGDAYVDVLSLDVYGADFRQSFHDDLASMSKGKPMVLGEVGNPPTRDILEKQPRWAMYVVWAGMYRTTPRRHHSELAGDPRVLHLEDPAYWDAVAQLRKAAGLPVAMSAYLHFDEAGNRVDLSGDWTLDEERSELGGMGGGAPSVLRVVQRPDGIVVRRTIRSEYAADTVIEDRLALDGAPSRSEVDGSPRVTKARWSEDGGTLRIESKVTLSRRGPPADVTAVEEWKLLEGGRILAIRQSSTSAWGSRSATLVYEKR